ncbi:hypothetical protein [Helicobacter heilmannii]|nr:hypothetical protein [Helicobacter heilmannii]
MFALKEGLFKAGRSSLGMLHFVGMYTGLYTRVHPQKAKKPNFKHFR